MATAKPVQHPSPEERAARGDGRRAPWCPGPLTGNGCRRRNVGVRSRSSRSRRRHVLFDLVPIRHARMTASPFAFYRGAAAIMAADLAPTPTSGLRVQACGDAHLANFGGFAAPDRTIVFDVNDFDETLPGPWEWDVKRLVASFEIAARARGVRRRCPGADRRGNGARLPPSHARLRGDADARSLVRPPRRVGRLRDLPGPNARGCGQAIREEPRQGPRQEQRPRPRQAHRGVDGELRIVSDPPFIVRIDELVSSAEAEKLTDLLRSWFRGYRRSLQPDRRRLLEYFEMVDVARKVVGVGSVGHPMLDPVHAGARRDRPAVPAGQGGGSLGARALCRHERVRQSRSSGRGGAAAHAVVERHLPRLGPRRSTSRVRQRDFYVRQLWDGKLSPQIDVMEPEVLLAFGEMCGSTLARAHARSGDRIAIAAYLGAGRASTGRSRPSPGRTRTRTSVTTIPWSPRSRPVSSWPISRPTRREPDPAAAPAVVSPSPRVPAPDSPGRSSTGRLAVLNPDDRILPDQPG